VHVLSFAAKETLIRFDAARKWIVIFLQHLSDLLEHAPCGLVGHARFAFKLFRGDTAASRGHEIDRVKPSLKRCAGLVIDRVRSRMNVMPTELARIGFTRYYFVMLRDRVARLAKDTIGIKVVLQPFKASIVSREIVLEILECVTGHFRAFGFAVFHARILLNRVPTVKG